MAVVKGKGIVIRGDFYTPTDHLTKFRINLGIN